MAVLEAKLCQIRIQIDNEKRLSPKRTPEASPQEVFFLNPCSGRAYSVWC